MDGGMTMLDVLDRKWVGEIVIPEAERESFLENCASLFSEDGKLLGLPVRYA